MGLDLHDQGGVWDGELDEGLTRTRLLPFFSAFRKDRDLRQSRQTLEPLLLLLAKSDYLVDLGAQFVEDGD